MCCTEVYQLEYCSFLNSIIQSEKCVCVCGYMKAVIIIFLILATRLRHLQPLLLIPLRGPIRNPFPIAAYRVFKPDFNIGLGQNTVHYIHLCLFNYGCYLHPFQLIPSITSNL